MSGIALIIPGADFSAKKIGNVTFQEDVAVTGIAINMNAGYSGQSFQPSIVYTPSTTNQKGVTWSITSGGTYATIDATTGLVTILSNANANSITVKAVSNYDNTIIATATTAVTYVATPVNPTALTISGSSTVSGQSSQYAVSYTPSNTNQLGVTWSITSGGTYATINANTGLLTILSGASASAVVIKATSTADTSISATKSVTVTYEVSQIGRKLIIAAPSDNANATAISTINPIDSVNWNNGPIVTSGYSSGNLIDINGNNWLTYINYIDESAVNYIRSSAVSIINNYLDITNDVANIRLNARQSYGNGYGNVALLSNNTGYNIALLAGNGTNWLSSTTNKDIMLCLGNVPSGTYRIKIWINSTSNGDYSSSRYFACNGIQAPLGSGSVPNNFLNTPVILEGVTPFNNQLLMYQLDNGSGSIDYSMIEIERMA